MSEDVRNTGDDRKKSDASEKIQSSTTELLPAIPNPLGADTRVGGCSSESEPIQLGKLSKIENPSEVDGSITKL